MTAARFADLDDLLMRLPVAVYRTTPAGRFIAGNQALVDLLGVQSIDDLRSIDVASLYVNPGERTAMIERVTEREEVPSDVQLRRPDGEHIWVKVRSLGVYAPDGTVQYLEGVLEDITAQRRADRSLLQSNALLDALAQIQSRYIAGGDRQRVFDELLEHVLRLTGSEYGFIAQTLHHDDGSPYLRTCAMSNIAWNEATRQMFAEAGPAGMEFHNMNTLFGPPVLEGTAVIANDPRNDPRSGGKPYGHPPLDTFLAVPVFKRDEVIGEIALSNRPGGYDDDVVRYLEPFAATVGTLIEAVRNEDALLAAEAGEEAAESLFRGVVEAAVDAVIVFGDRGFIEAFNPAAERLLGYPADEMANADISTLVPGEHLDAFREHASDHARSVVEMALVGRNGDEVPVEVSFGRSQSRDRTTVTAVIRDIAERKETEVTLRRAKEDAEKASRAKDEFLAGMSHELRTPLNAVIGLSSVLGRETHGTMNDKQKEYVRQIESSGRHLLSVINDVLDLAKIEADRLQPQLTRVDLVALIEDAVALVREEAVSERLHLTSRVDARIPALVADGRRTKQAILNLLSNAIKFTAPGKSIGVDAGFGSGSVHITVWDEGPGIPAAQLEEVFAPFERLDATTTTRHEGAGLGLALSRRFVEAQGGSLEVDSEVGVGSRFTITLPIDRDSVVPDEDEAEDERGEVAAAQPPGGRVLVVEDNDVNRLLVGDYLRAHGIEVIEAANGEDGVRAAKTDLPDVILMDIQMPVMDGLTATREIKADPKTGAIPVIALTALAMQGDAERCFEAGCDGYLSKPCDPADVLEAVAAHLETKQA